MENNRQDQALGLGLVEGHYSWKLSEGSSISARLKTIGVISSDPL
jgi:hypothetical protein